MPLNKETKPNQKVYQAYSVDDLYSYFNNWV